jgi:hypothetical protein
MELRTRQVARMLAADQPPRYPARVARLAA